MALLFLYVEKKEYVITERKNIFNKIEVKSINNRETTLKNVTAIRSLLYISEGLILIKSGVAYFFDEF